MSAKNENHRSRGLPSPKQFLLDRIRARQSRNSRLSLRYWALLAGIHPSSLARALNGTRRVTPAIAVRMSAALRLSREDAQFLFDLISLDSIKKPAQREAALANLRRRQPPPYRQISLETFRVIADWEHFAILSLTKTKGFRPQSSWLAERLGISAMRAQVAVNRLLNLGLLEKGPRGYRAAAEANIQTPHDVPGDCVRENHRQMLEKASRALQLTEVHAREFCNLSVAMGSRQLPEVKERIRKFVDEFNRDFDLPLGEEVFSLNIQFFPVSQKVGSP